ncbi:MAG: SDR family oxidoreductase [Rhodospirillaceae bacterium]|nr:SDR family oxidoreductase [Rhodospirillaceae bacterium]
MKGKVALVTGGNSGIGRGIVERFVAEGARVAIVARDKAKGARALDEVRAQGADAEFYSCELAEEAEVEAMVAAVVERFGGIDVLVNNAGVGGRRAGVGDDDTPGERWTKLRRPNLDAPWLVSSHCLPHLAKTRGSVVCISSTATWHGNWGSYGIAKAGVEGLVRSFAAEGAAHGIRCNGVSPGWIATERDAVAPPSGGGGWALPPSVFNRMGTPAEIAAAVLFLASDEASFVTGQTLIVDGGLMMIDYPSLEMLRDAGPGMMSGSGDGAPVGDG